MILQVEGLKVKAQFLRGEECILDGMDFCVEQGSVSAIVGESGSGKTMSALALIGLLPANCRAYGHAYLDGVDLLSLSGRRLNAMRGRELVYIPQSGAEFLNPSLKIKTQIYESLKKNGIRGKSALRAAALEKLVMSGLADDAIDILEKYPHQLSGGQAQRVVLAISLCASAKLVIADEPTKGIDKETAKVFEDGIEKFFPQACVILITHNIKLAGRSKKILVLKDGAVQEYGNTDEVLNNPKSDYTKLLINAVPRPQEEICLK